MNIHKKFIQQTYKFAKSVLKNGKHPFGSLLIINDKFVLILKLYRGF